MRAGAAGILSRLGWKPPADTVGAAFCVARRDWAQCLAIGASSVPALIAALEQRNDDVRQAAADTLAAMGSSVTSDILGLLEGPQPALREAAVRILEKTLPHVDDVAMRQRAATALTNALNGGCRHAEWVLRALGDERTLEELRQRTDQVIASFDQTVARLNAKTLDLVKETVDQDYLAAVAKNCSDSTARAAAVEKLADQALLAKIAETDISAEVRAAAVKRLTDQLHFELVLIGRGEGFLSMQPQPGFNEDCRNIRARAIGEQLNEVGGRPLMQQACTLVGLTLGPVRARELEAAWVAIGSWF
jgi:HEAT repeat protein